MLYYRNRISSLKYSFVFVTSKALILRLVLFNYVEVCIYNSNNLERIKGYKSFKMGK